ncbi:hypothetical protein MY11210_006331 [Beauveria gryllotalpidicola]
MQCFVHFLAVAVAVATSAAAAGSDPIVTSLFLPNHDANSFVATVLNVAGSATTFAYTCASNVSPDDCGMSTHGTVVQGPSTWQMSLSQSDDKDGIYVFTATCDLTSSRDVASCSVSETESDSETQSSYETTGQTTGYISDMQPVTLISGLDKLTDGAVPTASTASSASPGASSPGVQPTGSASQSSSSSVSSSAGASPSSGASSSSGAASSASGSKTAMPNAAPAATQQALLAGVVAVVGVLAL